MGQEVSGAGRRGAELCGAGGRWGKISGAGGHGAEGCGAQEVGHLLYKNLMLVKMRYFASLIMIDLKLAMGC